MWDPAFLSPVETSDTSIAKEHVGSQRPLSCLVTQPGCQGHVLVEGQSGKGIFLIFTTQNIKSPRSGGTV